MLIDLLREVGNYPAPAGPPVQVTGLEHEIAVPFRIRTTGACCSFFSMTTVFGTPVDVMLSELALELLPADDKTGAIGSADSGGAFVELTTQALTREQAGTTARVSLPMT